MGIFISYGGFVVNLERLPSERAVETVLAFLRRGGYRKEVSAKDILGSPGLHGHTLVAAMIVDGVMKELQTITVAGCNNFSDTMLQLLLNNWAKANGD